MSYLVLSRSASSTLVPSGSSSLRDAIITIGPPGTTPNTRMADEQHISNTNFHTQP